MAEIYSEYTIADARVLDNTEVPPDITFDDGTKKGRGRSSFIGRYRLQQVVSANAGVIEVPAGDSGGRRARYGFFS